MFEKSTVQLRRATLVASLWTRIAQHVPPNADAQRYCELSFLDDTGRTLATISLDASGLGFGEARDTGIASRYAVTAAGQPLLAGDVTELGQPGDIQLEGCLIVAGSVIAINVA